MEQIYVITIKDSYDHYFEPVAFTKLEDARKYMEKKYNDYLNNSHGDIVMKEIGSTLAYIEAQLEYGAEWINIYLNAVPVDAIKFD